MSRSDIFVDFWDYESRLCWANKHHQAMLSCYPGNGARVLYAHGGKLDIGLPVHDQWMDLQSLTNTLLTHTCRCFFAMVESCWNRKPSCHYFKHVALLLHALHPEKDFIQVVCRFVGAFHSLRRIFTREKGEMLAKGSLRLTYPHSETQVGHLGYIPHTDSKYLETWLWKTGCGLLHPSGSCVYCRGGQLGSAECIEL